MLTSVRLLYSSAFKMIATRAFFASLVALFTRLAIGTSVSGTMNNLTIVSRNNWLTGHYLAVPGPNFLKRATIGECTDAQIIKVNAAHDIVRKYEAAAAE